MREQVFSSASPGVVRIEASQGTAEFVDIFGSNCSRIREDVTDVGREIMGSNFDRDLQKFRSDANKFVLEFTPQLQEDCKSIQIFLKDKGWLLNQLKRDIGQLKARSWRDSVQVAEDEDRRKKRTEEGGESEPKVRRKVKNRRVKHEDDSFGDGDMEVDGENSTSEHEDGGGENHLSGREAVRAVMEGVKAHLKETFELLFPLFRDLIQFGSSDKMRPKDSGQKANFREEHLVKFGYKKVIVFRIRFS